MSISSAASQARESSRRGDGTFGEQARPEASAVALADPSGGYVDDEHEQAHDVADHFVSSLNDEERLAFLARTGVRRDEIDEARAQAAAGDDFAIDELAREMAHDMASNAFNHEASPEWLRQELRGEHDDPAFPNGRCPSCGRGVDTRLACADPDCTTGGLPRQPHERFTARQVEQMAGILAQIAQSNWSPAFNDDEFNLHTSHAQRGIVHLIAALDLPDAEPMAVRNRARSLTARMDEGGHLSARGTNPAALTKIRAAALRAEFLTEAIRSHEKADSASDDFERARHLGTSEGYCRAAAHLSHADVDHDGRIDPVAVDEVTQRYIEAIEDGADHVDIVDYQVRDLL